MKSIKPGRGPSFLNGISGIVGILISIFWTVIAFSLTGGMGLVGIIFPLFGICFIVIAVINTIYSFKNATGKDRYSSFDIVDSSEESDPLNEYFGHQNEKESDEFDAQPNDGEEMNFCPFCGTPLGAGYEFCPKCGKEIPG